MADKEKRLVHQSFMTTESEDRVIQQKVQSFGLEKKSSFFRAMVLNGFMLKLDLPEIREMIRLLRNLTNNVNQIARRMNEGGSIFESEIDDIRQRLDELWDATKQSLSRLDNYADSQGG